MSEQMSILMGCLLQLWYILASFLTWYTIDRVGRRLLFISMAFGMCLVLVAEAIAVNRIEAANYSNTSAAVAAVFFVFAFEACFTWGWMATVWVYPPEILPLKIRAKGAALAAGADFLGNFLVVEVTPKGVANLGWKFYIVWAVLNLANAIIVWIFYPETGGQPLEAIDTLFLQAENLQDGATPGALHMSQVKVQKKGLAKFQWSVVKKADEQVRFYKLHRRGRGRSLGDESLGGDVEDVKGANPGSGSDERIERSTEIK